MAQTMDITVSDSAGCASVKPHSAAYVPVSPYWDGGQRVRILFWVLRTEEQAQS